MITLWLLACWLRLQAGDRCLPKVESFPNMFYGKLRSKIGSFVVERRLVTQKEWSDDVTNGKQITINYKYGILLPGTTIIPHPPLLFLSFSSFLFRSVFDLPTELVYEMSGKSWTLSGKSWTLSGNPCYVTRLLRRVRKSWLLGIYGTLKRICANIVHKRCATFSWHPFYPSSFQYGEGQ